MSNITDIVDPGWTICYETKFQEKLFIRSWSTYRGLFHSELVSHHKKKSISLHKFDFWQEVNQDALGQGGKRVRLTSTLICYANYSPFQYRLHVSDTVMDINFLEEGRFSARMSDDSEVFGSWDNAEFLLAGNMLPQLAIKIRLLATNVNLPYEKAFFSPDTLQIIPYTLTINGKELSSSFGEIILLDENGWITEVILPQKEFVTQRVERNLPRWSDPDKNFVTEKRQPVYQPPPGNKVRLIDFTVPVSDVELGATLALPSKGIPARAAVLFMGGSGLHDRHGFSGELDLGYHHLLDKIAEVGIASLRFDKRGLVAKNLSQDILEPSFDQVIADALASLVSLSSRQELQSLPIFLIGHSQGGLVALELASSKIQLAGVVLLATAGRPLDQILEEQQKFQAQEIGLSQESLIHQSNELKTFFRCVRQVPEWKPETVPHNVYASRSLRKWYTELLERDPLQLIENVHCPLLILQGDLDTQVSVQDAELLYTTACSANIEADLIILRGLDHLFKKAIKKVTIRAYYDRRRKVSRSLITAIEKWIFQIVGDA